MIEHAFYMFRYSQLETEFNTFKLLKTWYDPYNIEIVEGIRNYKNKDIYKFEISANGQEIELGNETDDFNESICRRIKFYQQFTENYLMRIKEFTNSMFESSDDPLIAKIANNVDGQHRHVSGIIENQEYWSKKYPELDEEYQVDCSIYGNTPAIESSSE